MLPLWRTTTSIHKDSLYFFQQREEEIRNTHVIIQGDESTAKSWKIQKPKELDLTQSTSYFNATTAVRWIKQHAVMLRVLTFIRLFEKYFVPSWFWDQILCSTRGPRFLNLCTTPRVFLRYYDFPPFAKFTSVSRRDIYEPLNDFQKNKQ